MHVNENHRSVTVSTSAARANTLLSMEACHNMWVSLQSRQIGVVREGGGGSKIELHGDMPASVRVYSFL